MTGVPVDLRPAARVLADLVRSVGDDQLNGSTPCPRYALGDLLDHVGGLAAAFRWAAAKSPEVQSDGAPSGDGSRLEDGWRERIVADLEAMGEAWQRPDAWEGMTAAGGVDLPGEIAGRVALDELVIHGWDVARSTGRPFTVDDAAVAACTAFLTPADDDPPPVDDRLFGPPVPVPDDAPPVDRLVGLAGRDPGWTPS